MFTPFPASQIPPNDRQEIALALLNGDNLSSLALELEVSRKFLHQQKNLAGDALYSAFHKPPSSDDVLFYLPVTKAWLHQLVLALVLICHSSFRGVIELLDALFDYRISLGSIHNITRGAAQSAREINSKQDLSLIRIGALDELFQVGMPVFVGCDVRSTYCFLLSLEEHRDANTWGVRLLELSAQGLQPDATVADFATGLRAGQADAWPGIPCRGDVFHSLYEQGKLNTFLERRAYDACSTLEKYEHKMARQKRKGADGRKFSDLLGSARQKAPEKIQLSDDIALLTRWLREDILCLAGPSYETRCELFDFVVAEMKDREAQCPHRIGPAYRALENQKKELLSFGIELDKKVGELATRFEIAPTLIRELLSLRELSEKDTRYWKKEAQLRKEVGKKFFECFEAAQDIAENTVRASSLVENLNSRLRNYFYLRRQLGGEYLELLRFFLNHRKLVRSEVAERAGKSPREVMTGEEHGHWLELLGYKRYRRD